jgi:hypothetical protein
MRLVAALLLVGLLGMACAGNAPQQRGAKYTPAEASCC